MPSVLDGGRIYRTGDLAAIDERGEVEFFGRIDDQIKIRGYRVELSEIASVLLEHDNVASAAVIAHDRAGVPALAAYVVADDQEKEIDRIALLAALKAKLPVYMIPSYLDVLDNLPMLATGKVDRKRLPAPVRPLVDEANVGAPPVNALEAKIADTWATIFGVTSVGVEQDFFLHLGGHSLFAAQMVALLRSRANLRIAVRDVYAFPTVRKLAAHLASSPAAAPSAGPTEEVRPPLRRAPGFGVGAVQALLFVVSWYAVSTPSFVVLPIADDLLRGRTSMIATLVILGLFYLALWPIMIALGIAAKWLIIGRYKAGAYPLWGSYYLRWWLASGLQRLFDAGGFIGTPLMPVYYRLMGAKVGRGCALDSALVSAWDLVSIGDDTSIGADTQLHGARVENGYLIIGRVDIGSRCFVGAHSALGLDVRMGDDARLDDQSLLPDGATLAAGEQRRGSPPKASDVPAPEGPIYRAPAATPDRLLRAIVAHRRLGRPVVAGAWSRLPLALAAGVPAWRDLDCNLGDGRAGAGFCGLHVPVDRHGEGDPAAASEARRLSALFLLLSAALARVWAHAVELRVVAAYLHDDLFAALDASPRGQDRRARRDVNRVELHAGIARCRRVRRSSPTAACSEDAGCSAVVFRSASIAWEAAALSAMAPSCPQAPALANAAFSACSRRRHIRRKLRPMAPTGSGRRRSNCPTVRKFWVSARRPPTVRLASSMRNAPWSTRCASSSRAILASSLGCRDWRRFSTATRSMA